MNIGLHITLGCMIYKHSITTAYANKLKNIQQKFAAFHYNRLPPHEY